MRVIRQLFVDDMKRIFSNLITGLIILGLVLLPSIFSWYNVLACWDVFHNTGNLKVAVVNNDEGYQSDLVPMKVNMGEQIASSLRANEQMDWVFTDEGDAIDGAKSGKYYAAVVIPESFSKDMMTFYSGDSGHADLIYYSNEKKNVVAPKLTDQGASKASDMVNQVFAKTLAEVGMNVASSLLKYSDNANIDSRLGDLANHVDTMGAQMSDASQTLRTYAQVLDASQSLVTGSAELLGQAGDSAAQVMDSANQAKDSVSSMGDALKASNAALGEAISNSAAGYEGVSSAIDQAFSSANTLAGTSASSLDNQASSIEAQASQFESLASQVRSLANVQSDPGLKETLTQLAVQLQASADSQKALADGLRTAADSIRADASSAQAEHDKVSALAAQAKGSVGQLSDDYNNTIKPQLDALMDQVSVMSSSLSSSASTLGSVGDDLQNGADSLAGRIATSKQKLLDTASDLDDSAQKLTSLSPLCVRRLLRVTSNSYVRCSIPTPMPLHRRWRLPCSLSAMRYSLQITSALRWRRCIPHWLCGLVHCCWRLLSRWRCRARRRLSWVSKTVSVVLGTFWRICFRFPVPNHGSCSWQHTVLAGAGKQYVVVSDLFLVGGLGLHLHHLLVGGIVCQLR